MKQNPDVHEIQNNITPKVLLLVLLVALLWGGNAVAMKVALRDMPPIFLAGLRFAFGALIIWFWAKFKNIDVKIHRQDIFELIILSLLFAAQICTFNLGTKYTTAGRSSVLININPFLIAIIAHFFIPNDKLSVRKVIGFILAFLGIFVVFRDKIETTEPHVLGDVTMLISGSLFSILTIYTKKLMKRMGVYKLLLWQMVFGLVPFFGLSLIFERPARYTLTPHLIIALLYQGGLVASVAFIVWTNLLYRYNASKISAFLFVTPLFGVSLSALILHEAITIYLLAGAILVAVGIYVVNKCPNGYKVC
jgi:drug/metabolite transporter (DMT)-like permease